MSLISPVSLLTNTYADEIWSLYEDGQLTPDTVLTGEFIADNHDADVDGVMSEIKSILAEEEQRQAYLRELNEQDT